MSGIEQPHLTAISTEHHCHVGDCYPYDEWRGIRTPIGGNNATPYPHIGATVPGPCMTVNLPFSPDDLKRQRQREYDAAARDALQPTMPDDLLVLRRSKLARLRCDLEQALETVDEIEHEIRELERRAGAA